MTQTTDSVRTKTACSYLRQRKFFFPVAGVLALLWQLLNAAQASAQRSAVPQVKTYDQGSAFYNGYACIKDGGRHFYIDSTGRVAFDSILNGQLSDMERPELSEEKTDRLPQSVLLIVKNGKQGVLTTKGKMLLRPQYDRLDLRSSKAWKVTRSGKQSIFTARDGFLLPFEFNEVWEMDGRHFTVMKNGKWGVYDRLSGTLPVPCIYEDIDYCYGCESKGDYVFAKKGGNWGIVDLQNRELLAFAYQHRHSQMRSDEWVYSLLKNNEPLVINLKTGEIRPPAPKTASSQSREEPMADGFIRREKNGKWGMLSRTGELVFGYDYDFIRYDADRPGGYYLPAPYVALRKNGLCGIGDTTGGVIIAPVHKEWMSLIDSFFVGRIDSLEYLYHANGKRALPVGFNQIDRKSMSLHPDKQATHIITLRKQGKYGLFNGATGAFVPPRYDGIDAGYLMSSADSLFVQIRMETPAGESRRGLIDVRSGREILAPVYSGFDGYEVEPDNIVVRKDSLYGVYSIPLDSFIIPVQFKFLSLLALKDAVRVQKGDLYGLRDLHTGAEICPPVYQLIQPVADSLYILVQRIEENQYRYSLFSSKDRRVRPLPYRQIADPHAAGRLLVLDGHKARLYDPVAGKILEGRYSENGYPEQIGTFRADRAFFLKNGKYGFIDSDGGVIQPAIYDKVSSFSDGLALVMRRQGQNGYGKPLYQYGVLDRSGRLVVPVSYDYIPGSDLSDYLLEKSLIQLFRLKDKQEDPSGAVSVVSREPGATNTPTYSSLAGYEHRYYKGLADRKGKVLVPPRYDEVKPNNQAGNFLIRKDRKFGVVDDKGKALLPVVYDNFLLPSGQLRYVQEVGFRFPVLGQKKAGSRASLKTSQDKKEEMYWQYLLPGGKPLPEYDVRVRAPMLEFPRFIGALY